MSVVADGSVGGASLEVQILALDSFSVLRLPRQQVQQAPDRIAGTSAFERLTDG